MCGINLESIADFKSKRPESQKQQNCFSTPIDILVTPIVALIVPLAISLTTLAALNSIHKCSPASNLFLGYGIFQIVSVLIVRIIIAFFPVKSGIYDIRVHKKQWYMFKLRSFIQTTNLLLLFSPHIIPPWLKKMFYQLLGARIAKGIVPIGGSILDPCDTRVDEDAALGWESAVLGHAILSNGLLMIGKVEIGRGALVGAYSRIMPNVRIGRNAMVNAGSVIASGTEIGDYEVWGGNPAKCLGRLSADAEQTRVKLPKEIIRI